MSFGIRVPNEELDEWDRERLERAAQDRGDTRTKPLRTGRKSRSLLPSPPPDLNSTTGELNGWNSVALGLGADPIAKGERFGRHDDSPFVITLRSGLRITYERQAELTNAEALVRRIILAAAVDVPAYGKADAQAIAARLVKAADLLDDVDDRTTSREWGRTFLEAAHPLGQYDMTTPAGRYEALCALRDWIIPPDRALTDAARAGFIVDTHDQLYVRVGAFAAHVRGESPRSISWAALHGRMSQVGWEAYELEQRQPGGDKKVKLHTYVVPADWEEDASPCPPVSGTNAPARAPARPGVRSHEETRGDEAA